MKNNPWGQLMSINLYDCELKLLKSPKKLGEFSLQLCDKIKMVPYGRPMIEKFGKGKLKGYSLIQFIETSTITVHLDEFGLRAFIDIFSCKTFDKNVAKNFAKNFFQAKRIKYKNFYRN